MSEGDVLVVEDDPEINELVGAYVEIAGFHYRRALNGADALREAREHAPVLIVLDVMLPDVDGFEVCRLLKSAEVTSGIPVVMLTALDRDELRRRGCQCGAIDYLTKPFDPDQLMETIKRQAAQPAEPAGAAEGATDAGDNTEAGGRLAGGI